MKTLVVISVLFGMNLIVASPAKSQGSTAPQQAAEAQEPRKIKIFVVTDGEPDDKRLFEKLARRLATNPEYELELVVTSLFEANVKAAEIRQQLHGLGLGAVQVVAGTGGEGASYPAIAAINPAREFNASPHVAPNELAPYMDPTEGRTNTKGAVLLAEGLTKNPGSVVFQVCAKTDLVKALDMMSPEARAQIEVWEMGGHGDAMDPVMDGNGKPVIELEADGQPKLDKNGSPVVKKTPVFRTTYNDNMDIEAAEAMNSRHANVRRVVIHSKTVKTTFDGGTISQTNAVGVFRAIDLAAETVASVRATADLSRAWDQTVIRNFPPVAAVIGDNVGRQFTPADGLLDELFADRKLILKARPVKVTMTELDFAASKKSGALVTIVDDPNSKITHIDLVDKAAVLKAWEQSYVELPSAVQTNMERTRKFFANGGGCRRGQAQQSVGGG